jgi:hypothetical protein
MPKWSNLLKYNCPICGKKLHLKQTVGSALGGHKEDWNRLIHCHSKTCDFKIMSDKMESIRVKILENAFNLGEDLA